MECTVLPAGCCITTSTTAEKPKLFNDGKSGSDISAAGLPVAMDVVASHKTNE